MVRLSSTISVNSIQLSLETDSPEAGNCVSVSVDSKAATRTGCLPGKGVCADHPADCKCECIFESTRSPMHTLTCTHGRSQGQDEVGAGAGLDGRQGWNGS